MLGVSEEDAKYRAEWKLSRYRLGYSTLNSCEKGEDKQE